MRRIKGMMYNNCGSATIEMCFVMPVILFIIVIIISLFLDSVNDGIIRGNIYTALYSYDEGDDIGIMQHSVEKDINTSAIGSVYPAMNAYGNNNEVGIDMLGNSGTSGGAYIYEPDSMRYSVESGVCTMRLRRWQMYGDILWE